MKQIKENLDIILKRVFTKQHPLLAEIIINWGKIVGVKFDLKATPLKITANTIKGKKINILHVQVKNASIAMEVSFSQEIILERIAIYLGFKAIHSLRIMIYDIGSAAR